MNEHVRRVLYLQRRYRAKAPSGHEGAGRTANNVGTFARCAWSLSAFRSFEVICVMMMRASSTLSIPRTKSSKRNTITSMPAVLVASRLVGDSNS